jgi:SAM-dependent methyltransferase
MYNDIISFYDEIFPLNQQFLSFIQGYLGSPGSRVLDLGCGPGEYVNRLSQLGYKATGIDSSSEMIRQAQSRLRGRFFNLSFIDIHQLDSGYDCVFSMGNSLSYLDNQLMGKFFEDLHALLGESGNFVMQVVNWDRYRAIGASDFPVKTLSGGRTFHRRYEDVPGEGVVIFHTEVRGGEGVLGAWSDPLYPKLAEELRSSAHVAGLRRIEVLGDFKGSPFDPLASPATVLVASKGD